MTSRELFEIIEKKTDFTKITEEGINEDSVYSIFAPVLEYFKSIGVHVFLGTGVSKAAFVFADEDFVFKIPFDYEVNEGVELGDYCAIEAEYYHDAEIDGVDAYFAKTYLYDFIRHDGYKVIPVYYQEKATPLEETQSIEEYYAEMDSLSKEKKQELFAKTSNYWGTSRLSIFWVQKFIDYYGEDAYPAFGTFIDDHNINDLHRGNVGFIGNRPVVFDYSGYEDGDC